MKKDLTVPLWMFIVLACVAIISMIITCDLALRTVPSDTKEQMIVMENELLNPMNGCTYIIDCSQECEDSDTFADDFDLTTEGQRMYDAAQEYKEVGE